MKTASVGFFVLQSTSVYGAFEEAEGIEGWVKDHNYFRCLHGAGPVEWSTELEAESQQWADHLATEGGSLVHSGEFSVEVTCVVPGFRLVLVGSLCWGKSGYGIWRSS